MAFLPLLHESVSSSDLSTECQLTDSVQCDRLPIAVTVWSLSSPSHPTHSYFLLQWLFCPVNTASSEFSLDLVDRSLEMQRQDRWETSFTTADWQNWELGSQPSHPCYKEMTSIQDVLHRVTTRLPRRDIWLMCAGPVEFSCWASPLSAYSPLWPVPLAPTRWPHASTSVPPAPYLVPRVRPVWGVDEDGDDLGFGDQRGSSLGGVFRMEIISTLFKQKVTGDVGWCWEKVHVPEGRER